MRVALANGNAGRCVGRCSGRRTGPERETRTEVKGREEKKGGATDTAPPDACPRHPDGNPNIGAVLYPGNSAWSPLSDRALKANVTAVDTGQLLARLAGVPVTTWNYTTQDPAIRHIGPMAQDFYAAFGLGEDERHISTVDADGVALAAIQGLYQTSSQAV